MSDINTLKSALADRYEIEREIGAGGMARVYLARDVRHDRHVALKVLNAELGAVLGVERFLAEIKVTANLQHPNLLPLFDSGEAGGLLFYVMPFVDGESLRVRLDREKQLPVDEAVRIAVAIANALGYAHEHGVIHRDLKPENILLQAGQPVIADFGIALAVSKAGGQRITQTGLSLGTPQYMSPEQATGDRVIDSRSDIYSLAAMTYEMLTGEPPHTGSTSQAIISRVITDKPRPIRSTRSAVSEHVEAAIERALEKLPADRQATALEFAETLDGRRLQTQSRLQQVPIHWRDRRAWRIALPAAAAGVLLGIGGLALSRGGGGATDSMVGWSAELLPGTLVADQPRISPDGQSVAFAALVDGQTQLGLLTTASGDRIVLTHDRTRGLVGPIAWARDNSRIYFERFYEIPRGIWFVPRVGGEARLLLGDAGQPTPLPDGSLLVSRVGSERRLQMFRFSPESGRLDSLDATLPIRQGTATLVRAFPDGKFAAFFGRTIRDTVDALRILDLVSGESRQLLPPTAIIGLFAPTPDGRDLIVDRHVRGFHKLVAVARDGSGEERPILTLPFEPGQFDIGPDGSIYVEEGSDRRPATLVRYRPGAAAVERWPIATSTLGTTLPIPDGRIAVHESGGASRGRIVLWSPKGEAVPLVDTDRSTFPPIAMLGRDKMIVNIDADSIALAIVSIADRRVIRRLPVREATSAAGSPNGQTVYFARGGLISSIPAGGDSARTLTAGDAVAVSPDGTYLVVSRAHSDGVRLVRHDLASGRETEVKSDMRLASNTLAPNAIAADGRLAVMVISPASWFWPAGVLDPRSGKVTLGPLGAAFDMIPGWSADGQIVAAATGFESRLWRFRPVK